MGSRREQVRAATREEIKRIAREQMAAQGNASVSLHAIARAMGMTAPALYRYFPTSDDLITALIVDAYLALAQAQENARENVPVSAPVARLLAIVDAYRTWAITHPTEFTLIYGTPIPGYHAPTEITQPAAQRGLYILLEAIQTVVEAHDGCIPDLDLLSVPDLNQRLTEAARTLKSDLEPRVLYLALAGWSLAQGLVSMEIFHHLEPLIGDPAALYRHETRLWLRRLGVSVT